MKTEHSNPAGFGARFKKSVALLVLAAVLTFSFITLAACNDSDENGSNLPTPFFVDEFDAASVDTEKWAIDGTNPQPGEPGSIRRGGWWTADSVFTQDGNLVIRTTYDEEKNTFYTGSIYAKQLMTYGYYEARCKLPEAAGMWAAFWIMCDQMGASHDASIGGAEIDIFESPFYKGGNFVQHAIHTGGYGDLHQNNFNLKSLEKSENSNHAYEDWHTFALDWQPDGYRFYIDGQLTWETVDPYASEGSELYIENNVSSVPSYIILSVEVGGENGVPDTAPFLLSGHPVTDNAEMYDMSDFYVDFLVDYVKVWETNPYETAI